MIHEELELILEDASEHMAKSIDHLRQELMSIRAGRATPSMLENVKVDYYGSITPLSQMASINAPQADLLVVQPWDASALADIEKAIQSANLGLNPSNDGAMIRLPVPPLSEDRRRDLVKAARTRGEDAKVAVRNVRRHAKDHVKSTQNEENLPELSEAEKYGVKFRPRQTLFKNPVEARRVMREVLNEILANEKIKSLSPNWATSMPTRTYIIDSNWYAIERVDNSNNKNIRFTSQEKAILNVQSEKELESLKQSGLPDGAVVMVRGSATDRFHLWKWNAKTVKFTKIEI